MAGIQCSACVYRGQYVWTEGQTRGGMGDRNKCEGKERMNTNPVVFLQYHQSTPKPERTVDFSELSRRLMKTAQAETSAEFTVWD